MAAELIDDLRVKCLLLPLQIGPMLVPNSVIAEIVPAQRHHPETTLEHPWVLGTVEWRRIASATLPSTSRRRPVRPWVETAMNAASFFFA